MDVTTELETALARHHSGDLVNAEAAYRRIVDAADELSLHDQEKLTEAMHLLGVVLLQAGRSKDAITLIGQAASRKDQDARIHNNLGNAELALGKTENAIKSFRRAGKLEPRLFDAHFNLATALLQAERPLEAEAAFQYALTLEPESANTWCNLGSALQAQQKLVPAREAYAKAIRYRPDFAEAHANLGAVWRELGNLTRAAASLLEALRHNPTLGEAYINLGDVYVDRRDHNRAIDAYTSALEHKPTLVQAQTKLIATRLMICDWSDLQALRSNLSTLDGTALSAALPGSNGPFVSLMLGLPAQSQRLLADSWASEINRRTGANRQREVPTVRMSGLLRIGYLSDDFRDHPVGHIMHGLFGLHDRGQFVVHVYSTGNDDGSVYRKSAERESDRFRDIAQSSYAEAANIIHADGIDILINLQGHTAGARNQIMVQRPAALQATWLGYPATMGESLMDYFIGDAITLSPDIEACFSEAAVLLPDCYIPPYSTIEPSTMKMSRADYGLPDEVPVFCCFNASYKIDPDIFERWMNILRRVPDSVLWLRGEQSEATLKKAASKSGINPRRLIFTRGRVKRTVHLARHNLADFFLDTHYYNAHATALDALTAGLPILTCPGSSLAGRASSSMLSALGLGELVAPTLQAYEDMAVKLAVDRFVGLKDNLAKARIASTFFDRKQFIHNLETAFTLMAKRARAGRPPKRIEVARSRS